MRPTGPWVSIGSVAERSATPAASSVSTMVIRPTIERVSRSIRYTRSTSNSPALAAASAAWRPGRSRVAPEAWSTKRWVMTCPGWEDTNASSPLVWASREYGWLTSSVEIRVTMATLVSPALSLPGTLAIDARRRCLLAISVSFRWGRVRGRGDLQRTGAVKVPGARRPLTKTRGEERGERSNDPGAACFVHRNVASRMDDQGRPRAVLRTSSPAAGAAWPSVVLGRAVGEGSGCGHGRPAAGQASYREQGVETRFPTKSPSNRRHPRRAHRGRQTPSRYRSRIRDLEVSRR